jgi:8-oxo-dGTP pyrophosphatase MutT (NUDIX family)
VHRPGDATSDGWLYKFPGGMLRPGESYQAAGIREVQEETGYTIGDITLLGAARNYFPRSNSRDYKLLAEITGQGAKNREREEANMQQQWLTAAEIDALIAKRDPRVMFSHFFDTWQLYKTRPTS